MHLKQRQNKLILCLQSTLEWSTHPLLEKKKYKFIQILFEISLES